MSILTLTACCEEEAYKEEAKEKTVNAETEEVSEKNSIDEVAKELYTKYRQNIDSIMKNSKSLGTRHCYSTYIIFSSKG